MRFDVFGGGGSSVTGEELDEACVPVAKGGAEECAERDGEADQAGADEEEVPVECRCPGPGQGVVLAHADDDREESAEAEEGEEDEEFAAAERVGVVVGGVAAVEALDVLSLPVGPGGGEQEVGGGGDGERCESADDLWLAWVADDDQFVDCVDDVSADGA